jgi:hypothetical protein
MEKFEDKISFEVTWLDKEGSFEIATFPGLSEALSFKKILIATTKATRIALDKNILKTTRLSEELF